MSLFASVSISAMVLIGLAPMASPRPRPVESRKAGTPVRVLPDRVVHLLRRRRKAPSAIRPAAIAEWADHLARSLRHGSTLHAALSDVAPTDAALAAHSESLRHWLGRGSTVVDSCDEWSDHLDRLRDPRVELLTTTAAVLAAVAMLGGVAAEPLDRLAATMRQHVSADLERDAHAAQAKMSARVLTIVPLAVLVLLLVTDDDVRSVVARPTGFGVVAVGLTINAIGAVWMRRIASGATSGRSRSRQVET